MAKETDLPLQIVKYGAAITALFLIYKTLKGIGIIKSQQEIAAENLNNNIETKDWTNPAFYKQPAPAGYTTMLFTKAYTDKIVKDIYDSTGFFNDCEECIKGALKNIKFKTQYSYIADKFYLKYGKDMTAFIKDAFNANELYTSWQYLESLPSYKKK